MTGQDFNHDGSHAMEALRWLIIAALLAGSVVTSFADGEGRNMRSISLRTTFSMRLFRLARGVGRWLRRDETGAGARGEGAGLGGRPLPRCVRRGGGATRGPLTRPRALTPLDPTLAAALDAIRAASLAGWSPTRTPRHPRWIRPKIAGPDAARMVGMRRRGADSGDPSPGGRASLHTRAGQTASMEMRHVDGHGHGARRHRRAGDTDAAHDLYE